MKKGPHYPVGDVEECTTTVESSNGCITVERCNNDACPSKGFVEKQEDPPRSR